MKIRSKVFRSSFKSWEVMCKEATDFANRIPAEHLINISHSCQGTKGIIIVWYRADG